MNEQTDTAGCFWRIVVDAIIVALIVVLLDKIGLLTINWPAGW